jgi:rhodanese-related sulfurtransferase
VGATEMSVDDLAIVLEQGQVVVVDVREHDQFVRAHIPGSWPADLAGLAERLRDSGDPLWQRLFAPAPAGVGGAPTPVCVVVDDDDRRDAATALLTEVGLNPSVVRGGVRAWSAAGRPLNRGYR